MPAGVIRTARSLTPRLWTTVLASTAVLAPLATEAQDRVVLRLTKNYSARVVVSGRVEEYTGAGVTIQTSQGSTTRFYGSEEAEVLEIETQQSEPHTRGLKLLSENQFESAATALEQALEAEERRWVRREILATLSRLSLRRGDYARAGSRFLQIVDSDARTPHFRQIPLIWSAAEPVNDDARRRAQGWLEGTAVQQLVGASLLLDDPHLGESALAVLKNLSSSTDRRIQPLAQAQVWRRTLASGPVGQLQLQAWQERVAAIPEPLRAGPCFVLARGYASRHDYELAAVHYLWAPVVGADNPRLAARGLLEAAASLERVGQTAEAAALRGECSTRFPDLADEG